MVLLTDIILNRVSTPISHLASHLIWRKVICAWVKNNKETWKYWLPLREPNHAHCRNSSQPLRQVCSGHGACVAASAANAFPPSACQCNAGFSGSTCERTDGGKSAAYALAVTKQVNRFRGVNRLFRGVK